LECVSVHGFIRSRSSWFFLAKDGGIEQGTNGMDDDVSVIELLLELVDIEDAANEPVGFFIFGVLVLGSTSEKIAIKGTCREFGLELGPG
jgi:hypothetical protein